MLWSVGVHQMFWSVGVHQMFWSVGVHEMLCLSSRFLSEMFGRVVIKALGW